MKATRIANLDPDGVRLAMDWAEAEGWGPGLTDWIAFFEADPEGFFGSFEGDRTLATLSVVRGSDSIAFVGLYIVDPVLRGMGTGRTLWNEVMGRFEGWTLGLDGVPEQVGTYSRQGFEVAHENLRYSTEATTLPPPDGSVSIESVDAVGFDTLVAYDGRHFFGPRPAFLDRWIRGEGRNAVVAVRDGGIEGFAASRRTSGGHRIGPVFADTPETARELILTLGDGLVGSVAIDVPLPNGSATDLYQELGMEPGFETTRMYRGTDPGLPLDEIYGITSLELG